MQVKTRRIIGMCTTVAGIAVVAIAVLLFGLTETANGETTLDWVSVVTAIGGLVIVGRGLYAVVRAV